MSHQVYAKILRQWTFAKTLCVRRTFRESRPQSPRTKSLQKCAAKIARCNLQAARVPIGRIYFSHDYVFSLTYVDIL
jgi:hypothetical protein